MSIFNLLIVFIITTFLISGLLKVINLKSFINLVHSYEILPKNFASIYGYTLPFIEIISPLLLINNRTFMLGVLLVLLMLLSFGYAVTSIIKDKKEITCGCYGKFIDAKADHFTLVKIIIIATTVSLVSIIQKQSHQINGSEVFFGILLALLLLLVQGVWSFYQANNVLLNQLRR
ncbi:MauE/DoxX family redox-associated membrane protein [Bacillus sp. FJAT-27445]|uniref:MauE/DoxX family redox-associated membrane protein n=1 Tax=Bacillus sp. FJAT-27445 TaxID=1679166 RepID=UPI0007436323|nr:MauE/DoxX family redox-associated membrane protein [Bacillus sp. FJAT-27445]